MEKKKNAGTSQPSISQIEESSIKVSVEPKWLVKENNKEDEWITVLKVNVHPMHQHSKMNWHIDFFDLQRLKNRDSTLGGTDGRRNLRSISVQLRRY
jgi:hypothetical protein